MGYNPVTFCIFNEMCLLYCNFSMYYMLHGAINLCYFVWSVRCMRCLALYPLLKAPIIFSQCQNARKEFIPF